MNFQKIHTLFLLIYLLKVNQRNKHLLYLTFSLMGEFTGFEDEKFISIERTFQFHRLRSMKNTCYVNAALKVLFNIPYFMEELKQMVNILKDSASSSTICEYVCAIFDILTSNNNENNRNVLM